MNHQPTEISAEGYYDHDQSGLLDLVKGSPRSVLEIGCAGGNILRHYIDAGAERVTGVEYVPNIAERARARCPEARIFTGDVDAVPIEDLGRDYDLLVASFVLEHVTDPWKTLGRLRDALRPGGQFVGALPNVRHWAVTLPLLLGGRWDYQDEGVLDRTHYRFFTRRSIVGLLGDCGFERIETRPVLGGGKTWLADKLTLGLARDHLGYAYRFSAFKPAA